MIMVTQSKMATSMYKSLLLLRGHARPGPGMYLAECADGSRERFSERTCAPRKADGGPFEEDTAAAAGAAADDGDGSSLAKVGYEIAREGDGNHFWALPPSLPPLSSSLLRLLRLSLSLWVSKKSSQKIPNSSICRCRRRICRLKLSFNQRSHERERIIPWL